MQVVVEGERARPGQDLLERLAGAITPESNAPSSAVHVCGAEPVSMTVTVVPAAISVTPPNTKSAVQRAMP
jgi:hypothetical protein